MGTTKVCGGERTAEEDRAEERQCGEKKAAESEKERTAKKVKVTNCEKLINLFQKLCIPLKFLIKFKK